MKITSAALPPDALCPLPLRSRSSFLKRVALGLAVMGLMLVLWYQYRRSPQREFPSESWRQSAPFEVGMDAKRLAWLSKTLMGSGCVVRHGQLVYHWGHQETRSNVWSAAKPLIAHALYLAVEKGLLSSLDAPVADVEPRLRSLNPSLANKDSAITWQNLLNQTSCYGVSERPGSAFDYSDYQIAFFIDTLFRTVYAVAPNKVDSEIMHPLLFRELHCEDSPFLGVQRKNKEIGRLFISPRDFCRFGLLYLREGKWKGRQIFPEKWVRTALHSPLPVTLPRSTGEDAAMLEGQRSMGGGKNQEEHWGSYSNMWWTNGLNAAGERLWPSAPADTVGAFGQGGKWALVLIPSLDLVASWVDTKLPGNTAMSRNETGRLALSKILGRLSKTVRDRDVFSKNPTP